MSTLGYVSGVYEAWPDTPLPATDEERIRLGIPTREAYFEIFEGDTAAVNAHLAVLTHIRGNLDARANYIKRLPADKLNEVLEIIMKNSL